MCSGLMVIVSVVPVVSVRVMVSVPVSVAVPIVVAIIGPVIVVMVRIGVVARGIIATVVRRWVLSVDASVCSSVRSRDLTAAREHQEKAYPDNPTQRFHNRSS